MPYTNIWNVFGCRPFRTAENTFKRRLAHNELVPDQQWLRSLRERRCIVASMDCQAISERVATLKTEIATLRRANELYMDAVSHTLFEIRRHVCRVERLEQIMLELAELAGRRGSSPAYPLARKRQDWAA